MNQTIKTTFLFILLILGSKLGICQNTISSKGNVITKDAENLMGTISFDPSDEITSIVYEDLNGNKKTFTADDLLGIRLNDGSYFVQQPKIKSGIFVQKLFEGKLSVYKSKNQYILFDYYENLIYLNPNSGESAKRENYTTLFKITSGLCKIEKNFPYRKFKMNDKTLISIFREHHNCDNEKYTTYNKQTIEVDFSAAIGTMFQTSPILESRLRASSNHSISPMIQVGGRFKSSKPQYKKISLDISMLWNQFNSEVIVIEENSTNTISSKEKTKMALDDL